MSLSSFRMFGHILLTVCNVSLYKVHCLAFVHQNLVIMTCEETLEVTIVQLTFPMFSFTTAVSDIARFDLSMFPYYCRAYHISYNILCSTYLY